MRKYFEAMGCSRARRGVSAKKGLELICVRYGAAYTYTSEEQYRGVNDEGMRNVFDVKGYAKVPRYAMKLYRMKLYTARL